VGTIAPGALVHTAETVHPHGRGDNLSISTDTLSLIGSPPRAWGQCDLFARSPRTGRFTPTGVGTICGGSATRWCATVHPHGRGDNVELDVGTLLLYGSPPRAWGQSRRCAGRSGPARFTPTGVGTMRQCGAH